jgi:hypothetical protein
VAAFFPRRSEPQLDALRDSIAKDWDRLAQRSSRLPSAPPELTFLAVKKRAALTVFVFGDAARPLLVAKLPQAGNARVDLEARALEEAEPAAIAPRFLGRVGDARVQEALDGSPIELWPLTPECADALAWPPALAELVRALARLAERTGRPGEPAALRPPVELALASSLLGSRTAAMVRAALSDVARLDRSVLEHRDASSQNCLFLGDRLSGLVDWEFADLRGVPGFDVWNTTLAWMEYGVGLVRWSQDLVLECFQRGWSRSPFWAHVRAGARDAARAAGVGDALLDSLEVTCFARRTGLRIEAPGNYQTDVRTAARMLDAVCSD